jgi:predicted GIY-YIG superfamily endonuclease
VRVKSNEYFELLAEGVRSGATRNRSELEAAITAQGWGITRWGDDYVTFKVSKKRKVRFRFDFGDATVEGWVYALVAIADPSVRACYIGCTTNFQDRMEQHLIVASRKRRLRNTSAELFGLAATHRIGVRVVVLERVMGRARIYAQERAWTDAAKASGWELPGGQRWASKASRPIACRKDCTNSIASFDKLRLDRAVPLKDVVAQAIPPSRILVTDT